MAAAPLFQGHGSMMLTLSCLHQIVTPRSVLNLLDSLISYKATIIKTH